MLLEHSALWIAMADVDECRAGVGVVHVGSFSRPTR